MQTEPAPLNLQPSLPTRERRRRQRRDPRPHFKVESSRQLDPIFGCPALVVPTDHLAWRVLAWVEQLDTSALESKYSSLGRHGYHPKHVLGAWLLGSLEGIHHATKLALACATNAAYRLVSGGHALSATTLKDFRRNGREFLENAIGQTVHLAIEKRLIDPRQLAIDSVRIQADASTKSVRTLERSKKRLAELNAVDVVGMPEGERLEHEAKVRKHSDAVERCEAEARTSHSITDPHAALMKFPNGSALPGHRVSVTSCRSDLRFVVSVLITAIPNDFGHLASCVNAAREALVAAGMPVREGAQPMQVAADPGYFSEADLLFAQQNRRWLDVLIHEPAQPSRGKSSAGEEYFRRDDFVIHEDGSATCPAGREMKGPFEDRQRTGRKWMGVGCGDCPLKERCCAGKFRTLTQNPRLEAARDAMRERMSAPGAKARYNRRIATVEPVFAYIEDAMGFRRASSRKTETVKAEVLLKVLAYNLMRLQAGKPVLVVEHAGVWNECGFDLLASWAPRWRLISPGETAGDSAHRNAVSGHQAGADGLYSAARVVRLPADYLFPSSL